MPSTGPIDEAGNLPTSNGPDDSPFSTAVELAPEPGAASTAREWIAAALDGWPAQSLDTARLLVSELVTNAVLHARTEIGLRYRLDGTRARVEIADGRRDGPLPKRYAPDSPTGRGLRLVAGLASEWGVTRSPQGKTVWFVVTPGSGGDLAPGARGGEVAAQVDLGRSSDPERAGAGAAAVLPAGMGGEATPERVAILILGIPLDIYLEAEQHNDAVMRELTLLLHSSAAQSSPPAQGAFEVPARLLEIAAEVRTMFASASTSVRAQVERALEERHVTMDLTVQVPVAAWEALQRLSSQLDEVDRFCESGDLLTLGSSPRLRRFRRWYTKQVGDQLRGLPATPWPAGTAALER